MKIMITGANGFLGRNLSRALSNHELILIDREAGQDIATADINTDLHIIDPLMAGVDVVIHAANRARIDPSWNHYAEYYQTNITGSQSLLVAAQRRCVKKFIFISSSSVYGNNGTLIQSETDSLEPTNPYAVSKVAAEYALGVQSRLASTELIVVRPFTMYGEHMDYGPHGLVIGKFITAYQQGLPLELHGGGTQRRDFVHASDAVAGIKLIIAHGHGGEVYNLGSGSCVSIKDLAMVVSDNTINVPARIGAVTVTHADISKLQDLGYQPTVNVLEWLTDVVRDLKLKHS